MGRSIRVVRKLWSRPREKSPSQLAYVIYLIPVLGLFTLAPVLRAVWLIANDVSVASGFIRAFVDPWPALFALCLWGIALMLGRLRGPVVTHPFLAFALTGGPMTPRQAFGRKLWLQIGLASVVGGMISAIVVLAWGAIGDLEPYSATGAISGGLLVGSLAVVLWLLGQVLRERTILVILLFLALGLPALWTPVAWHPIGWVGAALRPGTEPWALLPLVALTGVLFALIPSFIDRASPQTVMRQSLRWESAVSQAALFEFSSAAETYQPEPSTARAVFAVRGWIGLTGTIVIRDAIASIRTPARLAISSSVMIVAGGFLIAATDWGFQSLTLGGVAALVCYLAAGALCDGLRHVCNTKDSMPLYGVRHERLLLAHSIFPICALFALSLVGGTLAMFMLPNDGIRMVGLVAFIPFAIGIVACKLLDGMKPPTPISLLTPVPTPIGDLAIVNRLIWALDTPLIAFLIGVAVAVGLGALWLPLLLGSVVAAIFWRRWTHS